MDRTAELREVIRRRDEVYIAGDIEGYLNNYAPDITVYAAGSVMNSDEVRQFIRSLFQGGGRTLEFQIAEPDHFLFSESGDAAFVSNPWRERFRYADGRETDTAYHETDIWYRRNGTWQIVHIHLSEISK